MGMFDFIGCAMPLPVPGFENQLFQTKDLDCTLDNFKIHADGTLWGEDYDIEDRSDPAATGIAGLAGMLTKTNIRPKRMDFNGSLEFYATFGPRHAGWVSFRAVFEQGCAMSVELVELRHPPTHSSAD